ncbi:MAG: PD40 domain-containing protein, partial [Acidobacteria bacterium]|nr:PD40 domain-containing protein [Acidobacteriota bacterium]
RWLIYRHDIADKSRDIWALPLERDGKPVPIQRTAFEEVHASLSPDGRWLAFATNESGKYQIVVRTFPEAEGRWQASVDGGLEPRWRGDGKELFYVGPDGKLMATPIQVKPDRTLEIGRPVPLFDTPLSGTNYQAGYIHGYDVARDGQRFLLNIPQREANSTPITVILNWTAALRK